MCYKDEKQEEYEHMLDKALDKYNSSAIYPELLRWYRIVRWEP